MKKHFYLKGFNINLLQLRFSVQIHIFFIFYKYVTIKLLLYKYIEEQLNYKKHFRLNKLITNSYHNLHISNNIANKNNSNNNNKQ